MRYRKLSELFPEIRQYSNVSWVLDLLEVLINDARSLLRLPLCEYEGGCNFVLFNVICHLIDAVSFFFYNPDEGIIKMISKKGRPNSKLLFKALLKKYYPWERDEIKDIKEREEIVEILWEVRNSITHRLGIHIPSLSSEKNRVSLDKHPLTQEEIARLEDLNKNISKKAFRREDGLTINLPVFYRRFLETLRNLFKDEESMRNADEKLKNVVNELRVTYSGTIVSKIIEGKFSKDDIS